LSKVSQGACHLSWTYDEDFFLNIPNNWAIWPKENKLVVGYTANIYTYKTIEANGNTGVIPTTSKSYTGNNLPKNDNSRSSLKDLLVVGMTLVFPLGSMIFN
jgi:hypothetical protein